MATVDQTVERPSIQAVLHTLLGVEDHGGVNKGLREKLLSLERKLASNQLHLAVLGQMKRGKSSFCVRRQLGPPARVPLGARFPFPGRLRRFPQQRQPHIHGQPRASFVTVLPVAIARRPLFLDLHPPPGSRGSSEPKRPVKSFELGDYSPVKSRPAPHFRLQACRRLPQELSETRCPYSFDTPLIGGFADPKTIRHEKPKRKREID